MTLQRPTTAPLIVYFGSNPDIPAVQAIYKQLGLKGHNGEDYACSDGTPLYAVCDGAINWAGEHAGGYGIGVSLRFAWDDDKQYDADYAHMSRVVVAPGQHVTKGQLVGYSGHSGSADGPHLHFAIRRVGAPTNDGYYGYQDPEPFFTASGGATDMDPTIIARGLRTKLQPGVTPSDEAVNGDAARMVAENSVEGVLTDLLTNLHWRSDRQHNIDANTSYADATGRGDGNPAQWAQDRVDGGDSFDAVIHKDAATEAAEKQALRNQIDLLTAHLQEAQNKPCPEPVIASTDGTPVVVGEHTDPTPEVPEAPVTTPAQPATEQTPASTPSLIQRLVEAFIAFLSRK